MATDEQIDILRGPLAGGVPPSALAAYGRWWQLETYLREVAYTELRAAFGVSWREHVGEAATTRAERDQINAYMASADADEPLAYADAREVFKALVLSDRFDICARLAEQRKQTSDANEYRSRLAEQQAFLLPYE